MNNNWLNNKQQQEENYEDGAKETLKEKNGQ